MSLSPSAAVEASAATRAEFCLRYPPDRDERLRVTLAALRAASRPVGRRLASRSWSLRDREDARAISRERRLVRSMLKGRRGSRDSRAESAKRRYHENKEDRDREQLAAVRRANGQATAMASEVRPMVRAYRKLPWVEGFEVRQDLVESLERVREARSPLRYLRAPGAAGARQRLDGLERTITKALSERRPRAPRPRAAWTPESVREVLDAWADDHGRYPAARELKTDTVLPSVGTVYRMVGSIKPAWTRENALAAVDSWASANGCYPSTSDLTADHRLPPPETVFRLLGPTERIARR